MWVIVNVFRYTGGILLAFVLAFLLAAAGAVIFCIISAYTAGIMSYFGITTPFLILIFGFERAVKQFKYSLSQCVDVIISCGYFFLKMCRFSLAALAPCFKKIKVEKKQ